MTRPARVVVQKVSRLQTRAEIASAEDERA